MKTEKEELQNSTQDAQKQAQEAIAAKDLLET